jgi:hypothetical protein
MVNIGDRFGRLTVTEEVERSATYHRRFRCKCDCGNWTTVIMHSLVNGNTKSCGCWKEVTQHIMRVAKMGKVHPNSMAARKIGIKSLQPL